MLTNDRGFASIESLEVIYLGDLESWKYMLTLG